MSFRSFLATGAETLEVKRPVSRDYEAAGLLKALDGRPVRFHQVKGAAFPVAGNLYASKMLVARALGVEVNQLIPQMLDALDRPGEPREVDRAPCQQVILDGQALEQLPLLRHCEGDGGNYISSGVVVATDPELGQNVDFHRMMQIGPDRLAVRVVGGRHFHQFLRRQRQMPVAVCIGNRAGVMLAAATSIGLGENELRLAAALEPSLEVVRARTFDAWIPADCELVLEGIIDIDRRAAEGPFVDLTGTYDGIRQEPVLTLSSISCREDACWQALLPGGLEHKLLMGMPREPTIFRAVQQAGVRCLDVHVNPGGCSWLHAVIQIHSRQADDGRRALEAAFKGHRSLKHAYVVDDDIDIYDPLAVEWAMATRFQGDRDLLRLGREPGSSLDPSADPRDKLTCKLGFDLTCPDPADRGRFELAVYPQVDAGDLLEE